VFLRNNKGGGFGFLKEKYKGFVRKSDEEKFVSFIFFKKSE